MLDERANYWTPVDQYVGGIEHAVMHLLYARFFHKLLRDEGLVSSDEPFTRLLTQGMVLKDGAKMSKSKGNVVAPEELIEKYGADTVRLFIIFAAPPEQSLEWSDSGVEGAFRFLKRLWTFATTHHSWIHASHTQAAINAGTKFSSAQQDVRRQIHEILQVVSFDFGRHQFNTVASGSMKLLNLLQDAASQLSTDESERGNWQKIIFEGVSILLPLLAPIVPHITHVLWQELGFAGNMIDARWPQPDEKALQTDAIKLVIQINGKLRGHISVATDATEEKIKRPALQILKLRNF